METDDRLEQMVAHAVDTLPHPDEERLTTILARIERTVTPRQPRKTGAWWLWLLLSAGAAAAAGGYWYIRQSTTPATVHGQRETGAMDTLSGTSPSPERPATSGPEHAPKRSENSSDVRRNGVLIYRHE